MQQLAAAWPSPRWSKALTPVDIAARPVEAGDKTELTGSSPTPKTIGIVAVAAFAASAAGACRRGDHGHLAADRSAANAGSRSYWSSSPAVLDRHVLALDIAGFVQAFAECRHIMRSARATRLLRNPTTGIAGCCARAASGQAPPRRREA